MVVLRKSLQSASTAQLQHLHHPSSLQGRILSVISTAMREKSTKETGSSGKWSSWSPLSTCTYRTTIKERREFNSSTNWSAPYWSQRMKQEETELELFNKVFGCTEKEEPLCQCLMKMWCFYPPSLQTWICRTTLSRDFRRKRHIYVTALPRKLKTQYHTSE